MQISVIDMQDEAVNTGVVSEAARRAAATAEHGFESVSIVLVDDAYISQLNEIHRGITGPTDVLSYEGDDEDPGYLGDVLISTDTAARQAQEAGRSMLAEVAWLTIHGVLHLLGHDDVEETDRNAMIAIQDRIVAELGHLRDADR